MATSRLNHPTKDSAPAYTFAKKGHNFKKMDVPAASSNVPIQAELQRVQKEGGTIGQGQRPPLHKIADYSESYEPVDMDWEDPRLEFIQDGPKHWMGKAPEGKAKAHEEGPGPGNYEPKVVGVPQPRQSSFGVKIPKEIIKKDVGPGKYDPKKQFASTNFSFGKGLRASQAVKGTPGPGNYNISGDIKGQTFAGGFSFGSQQKGSMKRGERYAGPGPGDYKAKETLTKRGVPMLAKRPDKSPQFGLDTPGPGTYHVSKSGELPLYSLGKSQRTDFTRRGFDCPGPGEHDVPLKLNQKGSSFGRGIRPDITGTKSSNPGPAEYTTSQRIDMGPKFSMGSKNHRQKFNDYPSPAEYDPNKAEAVMEAGPNYAVGTGKRGGLRKPDFPGPGAYEPKSSTYELPQWGFGTSDKRPERVSLDPGPVYQLPASVPNAPKYLIPEQYEQTLKLLT